MCVFPSTLENCVVVLYFHFRYISYNFLAYLTNVTDSCLCKCIFEQSDMHLRLPQIFIFCLGGGNLGIRFACVPTKCLIVSIYKTFSIGAVKMNEDGLLSPHRKGAGGRKNRRRLKEPEFVFGNATLMLEWFHFILLLQTRIYHFSLASPSH